MPPAEGSPGVAAARRCRSTGVRSSPEGPGGRAIARALQGFIRPATAAGRVETPDSTGPSFRSLRHDRPCLGLPGPKRPWMCPPSRRPHHPVPAARPQGWLIRGSCYEWQSTADLHFQYCCFGIPKIRMCMWVNRSDTCSPHARYLNCAVDARRGGREAISCPRTPTSHARRAGVGSAPGTGGRG